MAESASGYTQCTRCGARIDTTARFCVQCGAAVPGGTVGREVAKTQRTTGASRAQPPPPSRTGARGGNTQAGTGRGASQRRTLQLDVAAALNAKAQPAPEPERKAASMSQALAEAT